MKRTLKLIGITSLVLLCNSSCWAAQIEYPLRFNYNVPSRITPDVKVYTNYEVKAIMPTSIEGKGTININGAGMWNVTKIGTNSITVTLNFRDNGNVISHGCIVYNYPTNNIQVGDKIRLLSVYEISQQKYPISTCFLYSYTKYSGSRWSNETHQVEPVSSEKINVYQTNYCEVYYLLYWHPSKDTQYKTNITVHYRNEGVGEVVHTVN